MTWQREPDVQRIWNLEPQPQPRAWDLKESAAAQTRWDLGLTTWDISNFQPTLWDVGLARTNRWTRQ